MLINKMDRHITSALCTLTQMLALKLQKLEDEMNLLLALYETEESNMKFYETVIKFLLMTETPDRKVQKPHINMSTEKTKARNYLSYHYSSSHLDNVKEIKKNNIYVPKYEWTDNRTKRLLNSLERHYLKLAEHKDYAKPFWEKVRMEIDPNDANLKWHTCRHKWSHLSSDYSNYINDLRKYSERKNTPELTVYIPQYYQQIGRILRQVGDQFYNHEDDNTVVLQKVLEDKVDEALKNNKHTELGQNMYDKNVDMENDDQDLITISF